MKYNIVINQVKSIEWGLTTSESILYAWLYELPSWAEKMIYEGESYYYASRNLAIQEVPIVSSRIDTIYRLYKSLQKKNIIVLVSVSGKDYISITEKGKEWYNDGIRNSEKNPSNGNSFKKAEINPTNNNYNNKEEYHLEEKVRDKSLTKKESHEKTYGEVSAVIPKNRQDGFPTTRITDNTENGEDNNNRPNKHIDLKDHEETNKPLTKKKASDSAWRESMEEYLKEVEKAKEELIEDADFKKEFLGMFPNADYLRSIMKSMQYWTSEKAWELKKKSRTKKINMLTTLKNNLDKSIVYKNQQDAPIENLRMLNIEYSDQEEGTLADGTFIKNGYRYYFSYKDKRAYSIPIKAPRMPGEKCEFDMKTNQWYLPRESETMDEWLW